MAEAQAQHFVEDFGIFVETGSQADRVGKGQAGNLHLQLPRRPLCPNGRDSLQSRDRQAMGPFRIDSENKGAKQRV